MYPIPMLGSKQEEDSSHPLNEAGCRRLHTELHAFLALNVNVCAQGLSTELLATSNDPHTHVHGRVCLCSVQQAGFCTERPASCPSNEGPWLQQRSARWHFFLF